MEKAKVLDLIASYECGLAETIKSESISKGRKLTNWETQEIFNSFEKLPHWNPKDAKHVTMRIRKMPIFVQSVGHSLRRKREAEGAF